MSKKNCSSRQDAKTPSFLFKKIFAAWRLCASFCLLTLTVSAEELVRFPAIATAWDVQVTPSKFIGSGTSSGKPNTPNAARSGPQLAFVTVAQDNFKRRYQARYSGGEVREAWEIPQYGVVMAETPGGSVAMVGLPPELTPFGTAAFNWLKPEFRKSKKPESFQGKPCWYYEGARELRNDDGEVIENLKCAAWIEAETLLPVALDDGVNYGTFKFREETTLKIPDKFQKKLERYLLFNGLPAPKE